MSSGFITNYIQQSDGTFDCTLNTLDASDNTTSIYLSSVDLIKNEWCLTSPNNIDQILVMTNDSKYIYVPSTPFIESQNSNTLYKTLIVICINFYMNGISSPSSSLPIIGAGIPYVIPTNYSKTLKNAAQLAMYMYLYFFINNGISSYLSTNKIALMLKYQTITLKENDPNYNTWNQLSNEPNKSLIKQIYLRYAICMNYKNYMSTIDSDGTMSTNLNDSNWQYIGNFFKTIYDLYSYDASNFCINLTGNIDYITAILSPSPSPSASTCTSPFSFNSPSTIPPNTLYIPECVDCRTVSLNANSNINSLKSLCNAPSITINNVITYTPAEAEQMNTTFSSSMCILIIILIIICLIAWYFNRNNESSS